MRSSKFSDACTSHHGRDSPEYQFEEFSNRLRFVRESLRVAGIFRERALSFKVIPEPADKPNKRLADGVEPVGTLPRGYGKAFSSIEHACQMRVKALS